MSTFIIRIELHPSDKEQAYSDVHASMEKAGFSRIYRHDDGLRYHLPTSQYCMKSTNSAEGIRDLAVAAVGRITTLFMLFVSDSTKVAFAGLVPVREKTLPAERITALPAHAEVATATAA
jgi:hypothetical protein